MGAVLAISAGHVAIAIVVGFAAGVLAGLFGVGGGILFVPAIPSTIEDFQRTLP